MLEFDQYQTALEFDSDLSEVFECANTAFGSGLGCGDFARPWAREFDEYGAVINTTDAKIGVTTFYYDAAHSPVKLLDAGGADAAETLAYYNNVGHRTEVKDPNRGIWKYRYNGFGELKTQLDARALAFAPNEDRALNQRFDVLGRMTSRSWSQPDRFAG